MPSDIHPLPEDITAYFVYPFTLEQHVVALTPPPHVAIAEQRARSAAVLHAREVEEEQRERDALHKLAPGYNPSSLLVPTARSGGGGAAQPAASGAAAGAAAASAAPDPMDDLVAQLEQLENHKS
ncbi:hypothetical protein VHUM_01407 [Vanrija humicola]|uniref:Uncharacterized protein n=1 Tax=Vanrija humicola TaxID=5417 RepID=A0A7D8V398_VANHU|nr:hypothetical protein VHUM_01407 [Vanrija humicola]